jgi:hypothetical protein
MHGGTGAKAHFPSTFFRGLEGPRFHRGWHVRFAPCKQAGIGAPRNAAASKRAELTGRAAVVHFAKVSG